MIIIRNVYLAAKENSRMISEGSCDTEDWSTDAENSAFPLKEQITFSNMLK